MSRFATQPILSVDGVTALDDAAGNLGVSSGSDLSEVERSPTPIPQDSWNVISRLSTWPFGEVGLQ